MSRDDWRCSNGCARGCFPVGQSFATTLGILYLAWLLVPPLIDWAFIRAVWSPQNAVSAAMRTAAAPVGHSSPKSTALFYLALFPLTNTGARH